MRLGIDASNLRAGGGVTHLVELLRAADPLVHGFSQVVVWSGQSTLDLIEDRPWLKKSHQPLLDRALPYRAYWQSFRLSCLAGKENCNVLFIPGGSYTATYRPIVTMSQNLLPFDWKEARRYGWSPIVLRMILLRWTQSKSFRKAQGLIFLTEYAQSIVMRAIEPILGETIVIPHGVNDRFFCQPREQLPIREYSVHRPFRILYVSIISPYKHQWIVADAVKLLRQSGLPVRLDLIGPAYPPALKQLMRLLDRIDPTGDFVRYLGEVPHSELHKNYANADMCLFASSCENLPNILLEGMASGLPIASSDRGPMPEVLGDAGVYFNPESPQDIARALCQFIDSVELRTEKATSSFARARNYSWSRCQRDTFRFLSKVAR